MKFVLPAIDQPPPHPQALPRPWVGSTDPLGRWFWFLSAVIPLLPLVGVTASISPIDEETGPEEVAAAGSTSCHASGPHRR